MCHFFWTSGPFIEETFHSLCRKMFQKITGLLFQKDARKKTREQRQKHKQTLVKLKYKESSEEGIGKLPADVLAHIFSILPAEEDKKLREVSVHFKQAADVVFPQRTKITPWLGETVKWTYYAHPEVRPLFDESSKPIY